MLLVLPFVRFVDRCNAGVGQVFAWSIVLLTVVVCYEVIARYVLRAPTTWAFDASYMLYGTLFMMAGAYTLARNGHVRGDFLYRNWAPRTQAAIELLLYIVFFFPGMLALIYAGYSFAWFSWLINEKSAFSPDGLIVWPFKWLIPITGVMMVLQGVAECCRCVLCLHEGAWPPRQQDVEELEKTILEQAQAQRTGAA